jgi:hypothetical protein
VGAAATTGAAATAVATVWAVMPVTETLGAACVHVRWQLRYRIHRDWRRAAA